jgi:hypothetical protein
MKRWIGCTMIAGMLGQVEAAADHPAEGFATATPIKHLVIFYL